MTSIIIPTYVPSWLEHKVDKFIVPQLQRFNDLTSQPLEILYVINPHSQVVIDTLVHLKDWVKSNIKLEWIVVPEAIGFVRAANLGIQKALGDIRVLWNDDAMLLDSPVDSWLNQLISPFSDPTVGVTGIHTNSGPLGDFLLGYCLAVRTIVFESIGLLDEEFSPGGFDDADFTYRARSAGWLAKAVDVVLGVDQGLLVGTFPIYHPAGQSFHHWTHEHDFSEDGPWATVFEANRRELSRRVASGYYTLQQWRQSGSIGRLVKPG